MPGVPPIHVALNACFLDPGVSGGPESYLLGLAPALAAARPDARFTVLTTRRGARGLVDRGWTSFATVVALPCDEGERVRRFASEVEMLPRWVRRHRPTLLHSLASVGPPRPLAVPHVVTLHDLTFLRVPTFSKTTTAAFKYLMLGAAGNAARVITATEASLDEITALGGVDRRMVDVVPHGRRPVHPSPSSLVDVVRQRHKLAGRRVLLNVAAKRPHKNQELLIRALPALPEDVVVVLAGHPEPYDALLRQLAEELAVSERVRFLEHVPDDELEALWQLADAAAFPTKGEGFGLPVIEAMDRGLPVACSDIAVLREVAGGLAHLFSIDDPAQAATQIAAALGDQAGEPARRERAAQYTWAHAAELTWDAYDRAIARGY